MVKQQASLTPSSPQSYTNALVLKIYGLIAKSFVQRLEWTENTQEHLISLCQGLRRADSINYIILSKIC